VLLVDQTVDPVQHILVIHVRSLFTGGFVATPGV